MKAIKVLGLLAIVFTGCFSACKKKTVWDLPPNVLFFQIKENGEILPDSVLNKITLFYYDKQHQLVEHPPENYDDKTFLFPGSRSSSGLEGKGVLCSGYIDEIAFYAGANTMYLKYPGGDIDTIYIEMTEIDVKDGYKNRCYCTLPFTVVKFNGHDAPETTDIKTDNGKPIYLFEK